jgi:hypothetical protein
LRRGFSISGRPRNFRDPSRLGACLANGGALEHAQKMTAHESPCTTKLGDRTGDEIEA